MSKEIDQWSWGDLKYDLAETIIPKLENYLNEYSSKGFSIPTWLLKDQKEHYSDSEINELVSQWKSEVKHMIDAFKQILYNGPGGEFEDMEYDEKYIQEGLDKFAKYFLHLWD